MNRLTIFFIIALPFLFACTQKEQEVRVESVSVSPASKELTVGETLQLSATVSPSTATRKDITWSSSKSSVASVSSSGLVTALGEGTTTITATADGKKGDCSVSVVKGFVAVSEIKLGKTELTLYEGEEETLTASVLPDNATDKTITWTSSDKSIASVESGKVKAVKKGEAKITAKAGDKTAEVKVVVLTPISGLSLNKDQVTLYIGETETLEATLSPADATLKDPISWASSDESVAKVDGGKITAVGKGTAKITASGGGKTASCDVEVLKPVSGISLDKTTLEIPLEESVTLLASIIPSDATPREDITWSSSNTQVATVEGGKVTAVGIGSTTISASLEGYTAECNVTVKGMEYGKVAITDVRPVDILPVIGQVTNGDGQAYYHIEHLRLAEATRIRDMMWEYGTGKHSKEEYQQLMGRLNTGMRGEVPLGYDDYEVIGKLTYQEPSNHAHVEWSILTAIIKHSNLKLLLHDPQKPNWQQTMMAYLEEHPNTINIFGSSAGSKCENKEEYDQWIERDIIDLCSSKHFILFSAGTNIEYSDGLLKNKVYNGEYEADKHGIYSMISSLANSDKNNYPGCHLLVTIATDKTGDIDQTNETVYGSSKFPIGFADNVLFAGRIFPFHSYNTGLITATDGKYATSETTYVNVAMTSLCFQLYAEVADVDELLEMIRSTSLTDHIRFEGKDQPLQLINPAGLYKKYLTPQNLPTAISSGETISLEKGYYKGILFSIPGAEVKINGEWVAFDNKNKDAIMSQNPMTLEWRISGELLKKYGYTSGQTVSGQIITVDDKWGGLRLEAPMTVQLR